MRKVLVLAAIAAGLVGLAMVADAATNYTNTCTGTYQINYYTVQPSGLDTAIVRVLTSPIIVIAKFARNVRTGIEDANLVSAVSGDSIDFRVTFQNTGEADADTVVLKDYITAGWATGSILSNTVTATASVNGSATSYASGVLTATYNGVQGTDSGSADNGQIRFSTRVP